MNRKNNALDKIGNFCSGAVFAIFLLIFVTLSAVGFLRTTGVDDLNTMQERIFYIRDNVFVNILLLGLLFLCLHFSKNFFLRASVRNMTVFLLVWTIVVGSFWIISALSVPEHDSGIVFSAAVEASNDNFSFLAHHQQYFNNFPFQLGYVLFCEFFLRIFRFTQSGILLQFVNLVFLCFAYIALIRLSGVIFRSAAVQRITILLLFGCAPPLLFLTFVYGNIPGLTLALWASLYALRLINEKRKALILPTAVLISLACAVKPNGIIILAAICIVFLLHFLKTRRVFMIFSALICVLSCVLFNRLVVFSYELRSGSDVGCGIPKLLWMNMGFHESDIAPGWYNGKYTVAAYQKSGYDGKKASEEAKAELKERLSYFIKNPRDAARFFIEKTVSQWNEPTYESIWVSQVKEHYNTISPLTENVYSGALGYFLRYYMNFYQQAIFLSASAAAYFLLRKTETLKVLLPLAVLGGFFYHLLFEAKSQYILTYFIILVPIAAYGIYKALGLDKSETELLADKIWIKHRNGDNA